MAAFCAPTSTSPLRAQGPRAAAVGAGSQPSAGETAPVADGTPTGREAEHLFKQGLSAIRGGRHAEAVANLDASYRLSPQPLTMYALGVAYNGLGYPDKAVEAFAAYIDLAVPAGHDPDLIAAVQTEVARLATRLARFSVRLQPVDLELRIDGQTAQPKDGQLWLQPGRHEVAATAVGFEPFEQGVEVRQGRFELAIQLRPLWAAPEQVAAALCAEGRELLAESDVLSAVEHFERARALDPSSPEVVGETGLARAQLGDAALAVGLLHSALSVPDDPWVKAHQPALMAALARSERSLGQVLLVTGGEYHGARVWVSGRAVGRLPEVSATPLSVEAGAVTVRVALAGYQELRQEVQVVAGSSQAVPIALIPSQPLPLHLSVPPRSPTFAPTTPIGSADRAVVHRWPPAPSPRHAKRVAAPAVEAAGLELALALGYQIALRRGLGGATGQMAAHLLSIGYRPIWPLSFGVHLLSGAMNLSQEGTRFVGSLAPALYFHGHSQRLRGPLAWDVWGGISFAPFAMGLVLHENRVPGVVALDASQVDGPQDVVTSVAKEGTGISDVVTTQSYGVPLELGISFYLTPGLALSFSSALTFYRPVQQCYFTELSGDHVCYESGLRARTDLYFGFGLSLLP